MIFNLKKKKKPLIYDCFIFFNELELLKMRFHELYAHVDRFVIVESCETFSGKAKPLYFNENKHLFEPFLDKVIHVVIEDRMNTKDRWCRDVYHRSQICRGLVDCKDHDIIFISDCDELINSRIISKVTKYFQKGHTDIRVLRQNMYRFYLNGFFKRKWRGTVVAPYQTIKKLTPDWARQMGGKVKPFNKGGWHFSTMGGYQSFVYKIESFAHQECDNPQGKSLKTFHEGISGVKFCKINRSFPEYIRQNKMDLVKKGWIKF